MIRGLAAAALLAACAQMQSARLLRPGHTAVSAGLSRVSLDDNSQNVPTYFGEVRVAHGFSDTVEVGALVGRSAGNDQNGSAFGLAPRFRLRESSTSAISLSIPAMALWQENGAQFHGGELAVCPTVYVGFQLAPETELVLSPRAGVLFRPGDDTTSTLFLVGGAIGLSLGSPGGATLHPEIGVMVDQPTSTAAPTELALTFGLGVTAGD